MPHRLSIFIVVVICGVSSFGTSVAEGGTLRVGAARVDITPAAGAALPMAGYASRTEGFRGIHDHVFVRAIVLDDGPASWNAPFIANEADSVASAHVTPPPD